MNPSPPRSPHWSGRVWLRKTLISGCALLLLALLYQEARGIEWRAVWSSMRAVPVATLLACAALSAASHLLYSCFDLVGRRYTGHRLPIALVMRLGFISYAFNLNLGALIGGVGFRYRLYERQGLTLGQIGRIMALSMASNWLGFLAVAGTLLLWFPLQIPPGWRLDPSALRLLGLGLLSLAAAYPLLCLGLRQRTLRVKSHVLDVPSAPMAVLQLVLGSANWLLMGSMVRVLIPEAPPFHTVLAVLMVAAVAGVLTHIPAGMGVLEAVFLAWLSPPVETAPLLAVLWVYRLLYHLLPLALALLLYIATELRTRPALARSEKQLHG